MPKDLLTPGEFADVLERFTELVNKLNNQVNTDLVAVSDYDIVHAITMIGRLVVRLSYNVDWSK